MKKLNKILFLIILVFCFYINLYSLEIVQKPLQKDIEIYNADISAYEEDAAVILLDETKVYIENDFSYKIKKRIVKKINDYKGKKEHSEFKEYYDTRYEKIYIENAVTVKKIENEYKIVDIDKNAIREIDAPFDAGKMDYAVHKMKIAAFSSVEEGDILDITYIIENNKKDKFIDNIIFISKIPIMEKKYEIFYPENFVPNINERNFNENIFKSEYIFGDKKVILWSGKNINEIMPENSLPRYSYFLPTIFISFYKDFEEYKSLLWDKYKNKIEVTDKIKKIIQNETFNNDEIEKKIEKLKNYVAKNIQYKSINSILDFEVRDVDTIIQSGYASTIDRAVLLISILKGIGVDAEGIVIGIDKLYWEEYKNYCYVSDFNYFLIRVKLNEKYYYFETESEFYKFGEINCINEIGIVINDKKLEIVEIDPDLENKEKTIINEKINISKEGNAKIFRKIDYSGINAKNMREKYYYMTPIRRKQDYEMIINSISYNAEAVSENIDISYEKPTTLKYEYIHKNYINNDKNYYYFNIYNNIAPYKLTEDYENRFYPYESLEDKEFYRNTEIIFPENLDTVIIPKNIKIENIYFDIERSIEIEQNRCYIKDIIIFKPFIISNKEYSNFYKIIQELIHPENSIFLLLEKM